MWRQHFCLCLSRCTFVLSGNNFSFFSFSSSSDFRVWLSADVDVYVPLSQHCHYIFILSAYSKVLLRKSVRKLRLYVAWRRHRKVCSGKFTDFFFSVMWLRYFNWGKESGQMLVLNWNFKFFQNGTFDLADGHLYRNSSYTTMWDILYDSTTWQKWSWRKKSCF